MRKATFIIWLFSAMLLNAQEENYSINNLSENTEYSDFGVSFHGDSSAVFASSRKDKSIRKRNWYYNKQPYLQLFKGKIAENGEINEIELFSDNINTRYHESNAAITKDLKTVYFSRDNYLNKKLTKDDDGWVLIQLYKAEVGEDGEWYNIQPMPFNNDNYQTGHPVLNSEENKLYFTSDMPGGYGATDIYVVDISPDGNYSEPVNLGPTINTSKREMFPYIDENNHLFFSSDGYRDGHGQLDIYVTKIADNRAVEEPINLGFPINSEADDFSFAYKRGAKWGYFSSNRSEGKGDDDIYYFQELNPIKFECNQIASGVVREERTGALLPGALVRLYNQQGEVIESVIADNFGAFSFKVDCETQYKVVGTKENYSQDQDEFETSDVKDLKLDLGLNLASDEFVVVRDQLMININPIYFDLDKSFIRTDAAIELEKVVRIMNRYPQMIIALGSHTDSRAPDKYNWDLSNRRAASSIAWIIDRGIDASRISGKGYGETELVNKCADGVKCSESAHQLNRRTEFVIIKMN